MLLTHLKYWREQRGYSLRELAEKSKISFVTISLLENLNREPHGITARKLAAALDVELTDLYTEALAVPVIPTFTNDNKTITIIKPARSTRGKIKSIISFWVIEKDQEEADPFNCGILAEAERLKARLGGQHQARVYEATNKFEAWELHRAFLIRVARGHDAW